MNLKSLPGGVSLDLGYLRNLAKCLMGCAFGSIFGGAGIFMLSSNAPLFMAIIFGVIGWSVVFYALYCMSNRLHVKMGARGIYSERYLLGVRVKRQFIEPGSVKHLALKSNGSSQTGKKHVEHFIINAVLHDGGLVRVAESLNGRVLAQRVLEQLSQRSGFNISQAQP